jgi:hypothetical protein
VIFPRCEQMIERRATANIIALAALFLVLIGVNAAHTQDLQDTTCSPQCRPGYVCHQGTCVSMCNPPCGVGFRCTESGECVKVVASQNHVRMENGFVAASDRLEQGFVVVCNMPGSDVYLDDSWVGPCRDTTYINALPDRTHTLEIDRKGYLPFGLKKKIEPRERINVTVNLKKYTFDFSFQAGLGIAYSFSERTGPEVVHVQGDVGMRIPAGFLGINVAYAGANNSTSAPDTGKNALPVPLGCGISYRYIDVKKGAFSFEPGIKIGYFPYQLSFTNSLNNQVWFKQEVSYIEPRLRFAWGGNTCQFVYEPSVGIGTLVSLNLVSIGLNFAF